MSKQIKKDVKNAKLRKLLKVFATKCRRRDVRALRAFLKKRYGLPDPDVF